MHVQCAYIYICKGGEPGDEATCTVCVVICGCSVQGMCINEMTGLTFEGRWYAVNSLTGRSFHIILYTYLHEHLLSLVHFFHAYPLVEYWHLFGG